MNPSENQVVCPLPKFQAFFQSLPVENLMGIQSGFGVKIKANLDSVTFDDIKTIFEKLHQKDIFRNKKNWKQDQVLLFLYLVDKACLKFGLDYLDFDDSIWQQIAELIPGRTAQNCKTKIFTLIPTNLNQTPWTQPQQQILSQIIQNQGTTKWKSVSTKLYQKNPTKIYRSSKQCRERYMCFLKPDLKKGFWTDQEDYALILGFLEHGRKWSRMTRFIAGRNQNAIKNRFFLLFQESSRNQKLYYSEFMRKVIRRKQKLQKLLNKSKHPQTPDTPNPDPTLNPNQEEPDQPDSQIIHKNINIEINNSNSCTTDRDYKNQELIQIQKFFTF